MLQALVHGRGGFIEKDDGGPVEQHARKGQALLLANRQDAGPILVDIQLVGQMGQADLAQRLLKALVVLR